MFSNKQSQNSELLEITEKLLKLDSNNLREYFNGFNKIYNDLNEKKLILEVSLFL